MKWIITGGAGFIGCHAASRFHAAGHQVVVVDNLSRRGADANLAWLRDQGVNQFVKADIRDPRAMNDLLARHADADAVLHLAAQVAVTTSVADPRADFETNALGTFNVLEAGRLAAAGRPAVLYSSTNKVYGNLEHVEVVERNGRYAYDDRPFGVDESEPLDFHSPYGCSKGVADQYLLDYARTYGLKTVVFRMSCIYGPRQFGTEDQGWVAHFILRALRGEPITLYGDGMQVRDILFVDDLVDALLLAQRHGARLSGRAFNMGGGPANAISLLDLLDRIEELHGARPRTARGDWRTGDQRYYVSDTRAFEQATGWRRRISAADGIGLLYDWLASRPRTAQPALVRQAAGAH
jgi:CDP-paratose 2-epimerase